MGRLLVIVMEAENLNSVKNDGKELEMVSISFSSLFLTFFCMHAHFHTNHCVMAS